MSVVPGAHFHPPRPIAPCVWSRERGISPDVRRLAACTAMSVAAQQGAAERAQRACCRSPRGVYLELGVRVRSTPAAPGGLEGRP